MINTIFELDKWSNKGVAILNIDKPSKFIFSVKNKYLHVVYYKKKKYEYKQLMIQLTNWTNITESNLNKSIKKLYKICNGFSIFSGSFDFSGFSPQQLSDEEEPMSINILNRDNSRFKFDENVVHFGTCRSQSGYTWFISADCRKNGCFYLIEKDFKKNKINIKKKWNTIEECFKEIYLNILPQYDSMGKYILKNGEEDFEDNIACFII